MIRISGTDFQPNELKSKYPSDSLEVKILNMLSTSEKIYGYPSVSHLKFELNMRINIINASKDLNKSGMKFKTFKESICNEEYWKRTEQGGFVLKDNVMPSEGISDIFINGKKYGTECSTAIIILYYKAILDIYPEELFNNTFPNLHLASWHFVDDDLDIRVYSQKSDFLPGDCRYFENPDFSPEKAEWRGENAIYLNDDTYYGHGIGIKSSQDMITALNKHRKPGASKTAYLTDYIYRPYFKHLADIYVGNLRAMRMQFHRELYQMH